jgi:hypothetical protein
MFFGIEHTPENEKTCLEKMNSYEGLEICYETSPSRPVLVMKTRIFSDPFTFKRYLNCTPTMPKTRASTQLSK